MSNVSLTKEDIINDNSIDDIYVDIFLKCVERKTGGFLAVKQPVKLLPVLKPDKDYVVWTSKNNQGRIYKNGEVTVYVDNFIHITI